MLAKYHTNVSDLKPLTVFPLQQGIKANVEIMVPPNAVMQKQLIDGEGWDSNRMLKTAITITDPNTNSTKTVILPTSTLSEIEAHFGPLTEEQKRVIDNNDSGHYTELPS